ncbi:zinc ABC transporter substrate-binding protein [Mesobacillus maritimus]|uniref:metal ABC transporter solute-binding protein, Zn/Mn family n=1 Tax=Mesobacillus maritimus TaxID=1643336 RepID=UPI00203F7094|nr:zinc ABC transporter substrate-binding protein [Mesobacillus maritimus]MCM3587981.1 zinc ABC transporter substrate-binding protein [Mesobacillus maritimus]
MKKLSLVGVIGLVIGLILSGCSEQETPSQTNQSDMLTVYTTVYPLEYFAQRIGGEHIEAKTIYPPGADEHTYEPSQKDMIQLAEADLFIYVGLGLEGFVEKAKGTLENEDVHLLGAGEHLHLEEVDEENHSDEEGVDEHDHEEEDHNHGNVDPHVWIDPIYSKELAEAIKVELVELLPEYKDELEENYQQLISELSALNNKFTNLVENAKQKEILVSHSAYGYWEERYGIKQISISGMSTTSEPSQRELQKIISEAKGTNLKYVLFEQNYQSKLAEMVKQEIGAKSLTLHNLSVLTKEDIDNQETYFSLMEKNLQTLEKALNE